MRGFHIPIWRKMTAKIKKVKMPDLSLQVKIMLYIAALACAVLSIVSITCGGIFPPAAEYAVYTAAGVTLFLSCFYLAGDLDLLKQKIMDASQEMDLEKAIEYRELLNSVKQVAQKQKITSQSMEDRDIIAMARDERLLDISQSGQSEKPGKSKEQPCPGEEYMALLRRPVPLSGSRPLRGGKPLCKSGTYRMRGRRSGFPGCI